MWLEQTDSSPLSPAKREVDDDDREGHDDDAGTGYHLGVDCDEPSVEGGEEAGDGLWRTTKDPVARYN